MPTETLDQAITIVAQEMPDIITYGIAALVVIGFVFLIILGKLLGKISQMADRCESAAPAPQASPAPVAIAAAPQAEVIPNRSELVAAVSVALAEELGTDVRAIRILSIKRVS